MFNKLSINMSKFNAPSFSKYFLNKTSRNFAEKIKIRKDYYQILGIPKSATEEEIKQAYRNLAKRFHPDVSVGAEKEATNIEKFRDIAEAYAVLSNKTLRLDYDMRMRNFPDIIYNAEKMKNMKESEVERDITANKVKPAPLKGSYAEYRLEKLKEWRKQYNVDDLGNYKGGVPRKWNGPVRGNAEGAPGLNRNAWYHNEAVHDNPHARDQVTMKEADDHKIFMNSTRSGFQRFKPYYKMDEIEMDENYYVDSEHRRLFWIPIILLGSYLVYYFYNRFAQYKKFNHFEKKIEDLKPYEFIRHGPILVYAPERKFMNKFQSREEYHDWIDNDMRNFS